jgi:hypothetical protein
VEISDFGRNTFLNWVRGIVREAPDILMMYAQSESASMPSHRNSACVPSVRKQILATNPEGKKIRFSR